MNTNATLFLALLVLLGAAVPAGAQPSDPDKIAVTLTDPAKPAFLKVEILHGSIRVRAHQGPDVVVEATPIDAEEHEHDEGEVDEEKIAKRRGMKRITRSGGILSVEEDHNEVRVTTGWRHMGQPLAVVVLVPRNCSMKLSTLNDGDIAVEGVSGDLELSNLNGPISVLNVSGSVVADALNEDIRVVFSGIDPKKSMSFSSMNGDIDVTFPADARATLRLKNDMGEIYSDFDLKVDNAVSRTEDRGRGGRHRITLEKLMTTSINGGGAEIDIKNFNGDVYIRKGK